MSYFDALGFAREPFPNAPDPDLLYRSPNHLECLRHMEIAVRLRRGLNVVLGEVGTGKSTLCRELRRLLAEDRNLETHLLDDPYFEDPADFLAAVAGLFGLDAGAMRGDQARLRGAIKAFLARQAADERHIVTLLVDEGQKITGACLELLRELLNFESTSHKLLQIVIFAQTEFEEMLAARPNLEDRVNFHYVLRPLTRRQTRRMVDVRLALCAREGMAPPRLFTRLALRRIFRLTGGYPRKIVRLCHVAMLLAVGHDRRRIDWGLVGRAAREMQGRAAAGWPRRLALGAALGGLAATLLLSGFGFDGLPRPLPPRPLLAQAADASVPTGVTIPVDGRSLPAEPESEAMSEALDQTAMSAAHQPADQPRPVAGVPEGLSSQAVRTKQADAPAPAAHEAGPTGGSATETPSSSLPQTALPVAATATPAGEEPIIVVAPETVAPPAAGQAPALLGVAAARPGWTVTRQANRVYGASDRHIFGLLAKANPGVDFDRIRAGQPVSFPAIEASALPAGTYLVVVGQADSLDKAFALLEDDRGSDVPLALYVTFQPGTGLHFDVVENILHPDAATATAALVALPPRLAATARLVEHYPQGTVFFTDMGLPGGSRSGNKTAAATSRRQVAVTETR